jgi:hypothetical protein
MALWSLFLNSDRRVIHKWKHYFPIYEQHFGRFVNRPCVIVEIGCGDGGSLQLWKSFLGPHAQIVGIDINPNCRAFEEDQIAIRIGHQSDKAFLARVLHEFGTPDIVLDDGSHLMEDIQASFVFLYQRISPTGVYLVEDLHTAYWPEYGGGLRREDSFIERTKALVDELNADHARGSLEATDFTRSTLSIHFYDSVCVFERGRHLPKGAPRMGADSSIANKPKTGSDDLSREAYLDLLAKMVLNNIYQDPSIYPDHDSRFVEEFRNEGRDWPKVAHTMIGSKRIANLRFAIETVLRENVQGDFIETGVWRGGACIFMRGVLKAYGVADRRVYLADSFAGLPMPDPDRYPADSGDVHHTYHTLSVSRAEVEENFRRYGLLDENVQFIEGFFENTLPQSDIGPLAIVRLDGDMYSSTIVALEALYPRLSDGGFLIVDDYGALQNCRQAVDDYRAAHGIDHPMHVIDWTGVYWRKNRE